MDDEAGLYTETLPEPEAQAWLGDDLRQLVDDGRVLVAAELAWQKSRAAFIGSEAGGIALLAVLAAVLVFFALMALVFGLVLALAPQLSAGGAAAAVVGTLLLAALLAGGAAALKVRRVTRLIGERKQGQ